jgi:hypothetical protein
MATTTNTTIVTFCEGDTYERVQETWTKRVRERCGGRHDIQVLRSNPVVRNMLHVEKAYAWWDVERLHAVISLLRAGNRVAHIDLDVVVERDLAPLFELPYDLVFSTEISGQDAYPYQCSRILGFGVCTGFYVANPGDNVIRFLNSVFSDMKNRSYGNYSDQVAIMNRLASSDAHIEEVAMQVNGRTYTNQVLHLEGVSICVVDFALLVRDPIRDDGQLANHINIDNVGGPDAFLRYFEEPLDDLPLTCRCAKEHLGNTDECPHIAMRYAQKTLQKRHQTSQDT